MPASPRMADDRDMHGVGATGDTWLRGGDVVTTAAAVVAASRTGVLDAIDAGRDAAAIAHACGCDRRAVGLVLDVLVDAGLVHEHRGVYALPDSGPGAAEIRSRLESIEHLLRTGAPSIRVDDAGEAGRAYPDVVGRLAVLVEDLAHQLAAELCRDRATSPQVLDVAAGAAPFAIAFARVGAAVTALDLPGVVPTTRAAIAAAGLSDEVTVVGGDLFEVDLADRFDIVVVAGFCRLVNGDRAARAIARCAGWLSPGGTLVVVDAVDTLDTRRRGLARYALGLATRTATGRPHSYPSYGAWFAAAGLTGIHLTTTHRPEISVISATAPEGARR